MRVAIICVCVCRVLGGCRRRLLRRPSVCGTSWRGPPGNSMPCGSRCVGVWCVERTAQVCLGAPRAVCTACGSRQHPCLVPLPQEVARGQDTDAAAVAAAQHLSTIAHLSSAVEALSADKAAQDEVRHPV